MRFELVAAVGAAGVLAGCAFKGPAASGTDAEAARQMTVPPDRAALYVKRVDTFMNQVEPIAISVDGREVGRLGRNQFLAVTLAPGPHTITARYSDFIGFPKPPPRVQVQAEAGVPYVVTVESTMGNLSETTSLPLRLLTNPERGRAEIADADLSPAEVSHIEAPPPRALPPAAPSTAPGETRVDLLVSAAELTAAGVRKIAMPRLSGTALDAQVLDTLSEIALGAASRRRGLEVLGASDVEALIGFERQKDLLGCTDDVSCLADVGSALGVDAILTGRVGQLGSTLVLSMSLVDMRRAHALVRGEAKVDNGVDALLPVVQALVGEMLAKLAP